MLYALVAVFAACAGYAAGRLHQWYRMDADREEAYQAGYDAAARSTFTMAARMAGRDKSAVRASASVQAARPAAETPPLRPPPSAESRSGGGSGSDAAPGPAGGMGAGAGPAGLSGAGPAGLSGAGPEPGSAAGAAAGEAAGRPPGFGTPFPVPKSPVFPPVPRPAASPGAAGVPGAASPGAAPGMPGAAAVPGAPGPEAGHGDVSEGAATDSGPEAGPAGKRSKSGRSTGRLPRRGRHLVPQELVRAATYRLSPDRVARAKVPGALPLPGEEVPDAAGPEAEQPVKPTVPKPRSS